MIISKIKKNMAYLLFASLITNISLFIVNIIIIKKLSKIEFGVFTLILSIAYIFITISEFGISQGTIKYISEYNGSGKEELTKRHIYNFFTATLIMTVLFLIIFYLSWPLWKSMYVYVPFCYFSFVGLIIFPYPLIRYWNAITDGFQDMKYAFFFSLVREPLKFVLLLITVYFFIVDIKSVITVFVISAYITLICSYFIYRLFITRKDIPFEIKFEKEILFDREKLKYFLYLYAVFIIFWIQPNMLYLIIGHLSTPQNVAAFSSCFILNNTLWVFLMPVMDTLFPLISSISTNDKEFKRIEKRLYKLQTINISIALIWIIFIYFFGDKILLLLYGNEYSIHRKILFLLSLTLYFESFRVIFDPVLKGTGNARILLFIELFRIILICLCSPFLLSNGTLENLCVFLVFLSFFINFIKTYFIKRVVSLSLIVYYLLLSLVIVALNFVFI